MGRKLRIFLFDDFEKYLKIKNGPSKMEPNTIKQAYMNEILGSKQNSACYQAKNRG